MKKLIWILGLLWLCAPLPSQAQLYPQNEAGVTLSAWHTIVRDVDASKKFWGLFGGTAMKIEGVDVIKLPGVFIYLHPGSPTGPSEGTVIDHFAINCQNCFYLIKRLVEAGVKTDPISLETMRPANYKPDAPGAKQRAWTYAYSPDGIKIEIETNPCSFGSSDPYLDPCPDRLVQSQDPAGVIGSDLLHLYVTDLSEVRALYRFYSSVFGAKTVQYVVVNLVMPGVKVNIALSENGRRPTNKGRALDSVGFEVKNLEEFSRKLQAGGVKFEEPYSKTRYKSYAHAAFTDPWGMRVQLTEGLNRFISGADLDHARGKQLFDLHCSICHRADSNVRETARRQGGPGLKDLFKWPPHKLVEGVEHKEHTVENIRKVIMDGTGRMDAVGVVLSDQDVDDILGYVQTL